jgi:type IX secretion system PorP/SprF family membrane protein
MKYYVLHILIFYSVTLFSQDIHFSQFNENAALVNPAMTGVANPLKASVCYKDQWRSITVPYRTFGVSFETRLNNSSWQQVDKFRTMTFKERSVGRLAWGLSVYGDKAGSGNLGSTLANFSLATFVPTGKKSFLSLGLQTRFVQRRVDNGNLVFPSQYSGSGYDPGLPQREKISTPNYNYVSFAAGCLWSYGQEEKRIATNSQVKAKVGFSFYNIAQPHESFYPYKQTSTLKYVAHGDLLFAPANFNFAFVPSFIFQLHGSSSEFVSGLSIKYNINHNSKYTGYLKRSFLDYGVYYRNKDAIIFMAAFEKEEQYAIILSYDVNTSQLVGVSTSRGGFELTLRYTPPKAFLYQKKAPAQ